MKKLKTIILLVSTFLLVGCNGYTRSFEKLKQINPEPNYYFVGTAGVTKDNNHYSFVKEIKGQLKAEKRKIYSDTGYLDSYFFTDDRMYFVYRYYWSGDVEKEYSKTSINFCFGYFDVNVFVK